jgi:hypothetical protein
MDDMMVPEKIDHMLDTMHPVAGQIDANKTKGIHPYWRGIPMEQLNVFD